mmetsp:Transcript_18806/g.40362  ORF Transcript_18806/g.40362 Transcript_18806/m.40362 type:complete len:81 (+) Transcript_18806:271-513(+)
MSAAFLQSRQIFHFSIFRPLRPNEAKRSLHVVLGLLSNLRAASASLSSRPALSIRGECPGNYSYQYMIFVLLYSFSSPAT